MFYRSVQTEESNLLSSERDSYRTSLRLLVDSNYITSDEWKELQIINAQ